jgi:hypothetical protein
MRSRYPFAPLFAVFAATADAQTAITPPGPPPAVFSIGQPPQWQFDASALGLVRERDDQGAARLIAGVRRPILNPLTGLLAARAEAYATLGSPTAGIRALAEIQALGLAAGIDWAPADRRVATLLRFQTAIRRGGIVGHGSMVRVDWLPALSSVGVGLSVPVGNPLAGRTRPRTTAVSLATVRTTADAEGVPARVDAGELGDVVATLSAYSNAYSGRSAGVIRTDPRGFASTLVRYDSLLRRAFSTALANDAAGARAARLARQTVFEQVLVPIDSLFGQPKADGDALGPLRAAARARFARVLTDSLRAPADARGRALASFDAWTSAIADSYDALSRDAGDSRVVWLPLNLALTPDRYDDQAEVDSLVARMVGHPFTDQNALTYLRSSDLPIEIARSIYAARDYHVLWTHDFTGRRETGAIDNIAYEMVADAYLPALTAAVKRYDSTGVLPTYIILQDQFFYEPRDNRIWMNILESPLTASMALPGDEAQREEHLRRRQAELRAAVAASARLQRDARTSGTPARWLAERVKVHVNIVEPSDFSFRSSYIIPGVPFTPDNVMRDHRKIVMYDLNERDPYRGALLLMGVGIGEHYASATWEDRGYRVRGPATLDARRALREALLRNGFTESRMPLPLRAAESVKATEQAANTRAYVGRAIQVQNEVGFAQKSSSVARALLYDLALPGSVIIVPDPMWLSDTWAGMLAGAAARGCHVYIIAPAAANAPSPQAPLMAVQHEVIGRLLTLQDSLGGPVRRAGGDLRIGIFAAQAQINDATGRINEIRAGLRAAPWIRDVVPFDARALAVLEEPAVVAATGNGSTTLARDIKPRAPQLHQKSQLVARPGAIAALLAQPGWEDAIRRSLQAQAQQTTKFADQLGYTNPDVDTAAARGNDAILRGYEQRVPAAERHRVSFYFSLGSQNEDPRGIVSDAEATLIVSGVQASVGLVDLFTLMARSTWITNTEELERYVPRPSGWMRWLAWRLRSTF